jgi:hypothetical protein
LLLYEALWWICDGDIRVMRASLDLARKDLRGNCGPDLVMAALLTIQRQPKSSILALFSTPDLESVVCALMQDDASSSVRTCATAVFGALLLDAWIAVDEASSTSAPLSSFSDGLRRRQDVHDKVW